MVPAAHRPWRRRITSTVVVVSALLGWLVIAPPDAQASFDRSGVRAVTAQTAAVVPGQSAWLAVVWSADRTVTNWSTTVTAPAKVTVTYPTTRGGNDTSLYGSATLVGGTRDFTAFKLKVPYTQQTSFQVTLRSEYTGTCSSLLLCREWGWVNENWGEHDDWRNFSKRTFTTSATVTVPVQPPVGPAFTQNTTSVSIGAGSDTFQEIGFTGGQADLAGFTVRLGALPPGLQVAYPGDADFTGLAGDSSLGGGRTDHVGVRFIATGIARGTYSIPLVIGYTAASPQTTAGTVTLVVQ
jgi:hypothetical protein